MSYPIRMGGRNLQSHVSHPEIGAKITYKSQGLERWFSSKIPSHGSMRIPRMRELKNSVWGCVLVMLALGKQTWVDPLGSQASQPA